MPEIEEGKKTTIKKDNKISVKQIVNEAKLHPYYKSFMEKKYKGEKYTKTEWKKILKSEGF